MDIDCTPHGFDETRGFSTTPGITALDMQSFCCAYLVAATTILRAMNDVYIVSTGCEQLVWQSALSRPQHHPIPLCSRGGTTTKSPTSSALAHTDKYLLNNANKPGGDLNPED
ncbi:hypothetical protein Pst134EB_014472 [Puccinia striiformis f. sp. tritici]|nr:hypothetical protein Pst134EB_014472 [Puccinia striiformis f. sp. tritici]